MSDEERDERPAASGEEGAAPSAEPAAPEAPAPPPPPAKPAWEELPVDPAVEDAAADPLVAALAQSYGAAIGSAVRRAGELVIGVDRASIREVCAALKEGHGFTLLVDICGVHYPEREGAEFEVVYQLLDLEGARRVRLRVTAPDGEEVPSVVSVWRGADWCEREAYDMYGIRFTDHPDMTRILMWEGFNGHPLRKDFPVEGIDTGSAIYPEFYEEQAGPVAGTGTGWKAPKPEPPAEEPAAGAVESEEAPGEA